jgi:hypothetical protein
MTILQWGIVLQIVGIGLEGVGVLMTLNGILCTVKLTQLHQLLTSALYRGPTAQGVRFGPPEEVDQVIVLQGIAFLILAFLLEIIGTIFILYGELNGKLH